MFARVPAHRYQDPLDLIWLECATRVGFRVHRASDAYASYDGRGTILIATPDQFDADDNLGQMIFHELCHALVEGDLGETQLDWGLDNTRAGHPWREHACLRTQAWLADQFGLRDFLAPTTDYRVSFWEGLGIHPLLVAETEGGRREKSAVAARKAIHRSRLPRWHQPLTDALNRTRIILDLVSPLDLGVTQGLPSLWSVPSAPPPPHPAGHAPILPGIGNEGCNSCAWSYSERGIARCRHVPRVKVGNDAPACMLHESKNELDCLTCGACCREAYDSVEVSQRDAVRKSHPDLVIHQGGRLKLLRDHERCAALEGGQRSGEPYSCRIYPDRPRTCRDFTLGSRNCLDARRKVGLSL
jgi:Putative zinc- or iron-chelating domain